MMMKPMEGGEKRGKRRGGKRILKRDGNENLKEKQ